jgi:TetR/AcrR family transcriptional repressor of nem operon
MGRPREYNREVVVEKATSLFWTQGYRDASVGDLVRETALNSASMYKEFGDKDGLFLEALKFYRGHIVSPRFRILVERPNLSGVEAFLHSVLSGAARSEYQGCLMMNHLAQKNVIAEDAAQAIAAFCAELESLLETAFRNARDAGEIPADRDPASLASFVAFCVHGTVLYGRNDAKKPALSGLYDHIMRAITG